MPPLTRKEQKAIAGHLPQISWKKRPSELRGYARTFYVNADNGDYVRIDYNLREKRVRIFLEDHEEGGIGYFSVIEKGTVVNEKNIATGRNTQLNARFSKRADILATLPTKYARHR
jgi:hypothetical protein